MKTCTKCNQPKPLTSFHKDRSRASGLFPQCKSCVKVNSTKYYVTNKEQCNQKRRQHYLDNKEHHAQLTKAYYHKHLDKITAYKQRWSHDNYEKGIFTRSKRRAQLSNIEHTIRLKDIIIPVVCPYLEIPLTRTHGQGQLPTNASIDRIDNSKGYTPDNIQIISRLANTMKNNATNKQLIEFSKSILRLYSI